MNKKYLGLFLAFSIAVMGSEVIYHGVKEANNNKNILQTDIGTLDEFGDVKMKSCLEKGEFNKYDLTISKDGAKVKENLDSDWYNKSIDVNDKEFNRCRFHYEKYYKDDEIMVGVNRDWHTYDDYSIDIVYKRVGDKEIKAFEYNTNEKQQNGIYIVSVAKKVEDILLVYTKKIDDTNFEINVGKIDFENSKVDIINSQKFYVESNNSGDFNTRVFTKNEKVYLYVTDIDKKVKFKVLNLKNYALEDLVVNLPEESNGYMLKYFCDENNMYILSSGAKDVKSESRISVVKFNIKNGEEDSFLLDPEITDEINNIDDGDLYVDGDKVFISQPYLEKKDGCPEEKVLIRILDFNKKELLYKGTVNEGRNNYIEFF